MTLSLAFEILVSLLLVVTIFYCFRLDRRLKALRSGQDGVRSSIEQLMQATAQAEHSVNILTRSGESVTNELEARIIEAKTLCLKLGQDGVSKRATRPQKRMPVMPKTGNIERMDASQHSGLMDRLKQAS